MANERQWEYSSAQLAQAERHQSALDTAEGLPRKARLVTPGRHAPIPDTYSAGAIGWSDHLVDIDELTGPPVEYAVQRSRRVQAHEGKTIRDAGGNYTIPDNATAVNRAVKWDDSRPRGVVAANPIKVAP